MPYPLLALAVISAAVAICVLAWLASLATRNGS